MRADAAAVGRRSSPSGRRAGHRARSGSAAAARAARRVEQIHALHEQRPVRGGASTAVVGSGAVPQRPAAAEVASTRRDSTSSRAAQSRTAIRGGKSNPGEHVAYQQRPRCHASRMKLRDAATCRAAAEPGKPYVSHAADYRNARPRRRMARGMIEMTDEDRRCDCSSASTSHVRRAGQPARSDRTAARLPAWPRGHLPAASRRR